MKDSVISKALLVPGQPHILLAHEKSPAWTSLYKSYAKLREEIEKTDADLILYFSTQWLSVIGYLFQADPKPEWLHVDSNWHELGSMPYKFKIDTEFAKTYADLVRPLGHNAALVNYRGFPIDTGTIVAQKLLNPQNRIPAAMVSCNMYAEKEETLSIGASAAQALEKSGKTAIAVLVSGLSNRFFTHEIDPREDHISSAKDDEWNRKICELLGEGRLEDVSQIAREFASEANGDMGFKGIWWLNGLCGQTNSFKGKVYDYQPVWGSGNALVSLTPSHPIRPKPVQPKKASLQESSVTKSEKAPEPVGAYPHARRHGDLLYLSGIGPREKGKKEIPGVELNPEGKILNYDIQRQTHSVIQNINIILEAAGSSLDKIVDIQVFLTNMKEDFKSFNNVYAKYFSVDGPTRTTAEVGSLPTPIAVEFKVVARI